MEEVVQIMVVVRITIGEIEINLNAKFVLNLGIVLIVVSFGMFPLEQIILVQLLQT